MSAWPRSMAPRPMERATEDATAPPSAPADIMAININIGKTMANAAKDLVPSWPTYHTSAILTDD